MANVTTPGNDITETFCANVAYEFKAADIVNCLTLKWVIIEKPDGVSDDDIIFSAPEDVETLITVPLEGQYAFAVNCCEAV